MNVKELLEILNKGLKENQITEDTEVVVLGEYCLGDDISSCHIFKGMVRTGEELKEDGDMETVVAINVENYLHEMCDFRDCTMWMDWSDYEEMKDNE